MVLWTYQTEGRAHSCTSNAWILTHPFYGLPFLTDQVCWRGAAGEIGSDKAITENGSRERLMI